MSIASYLKFACMLLGLAAGQEFAMGEHSADIVIALVSAWREEARMPRALGVDFSVGRKDAKWDTEDLVKDEQHIDGFIGASEATQILWMTFMVTGSVILAFVYPLIAFNEHKLLTLRKVQDTIDEKLFIAENGKTSKENENRLIFAQGRLSFA